MSDRLCPFMPIISKSICMYANAPQITGESTYFGICQKEKCMAYANESCARLQPNSVGSNLE